MSTSASRTTGTGGDSSESVELEAITNVFRPVLTRYLDPNSVLPYLSVLRFGPKYRDINETCRRRLSEGVTCLLDEMQGLSEAERRGVAKQFMSGLKRSGNHFLHDVITGAAKLDENWDLYTTLLKTMDVDFVTKIPPLELMVHLPCLTLTDEERIKCIVERYGKVQGARELFLRLEAKPPSTLLQIEEGLVAIGFAEKARDIGEVREQVDAETLKKKEEDDSVVSLPEKDDANKTTSDDNQDSTRPPSPDSNVETGGNRAPSGEICSVVGGGGQPTGNGVVVLDDPTGFRISADATIPALNSADASNVILQSLLQPSAAREESTDTSPAPQAASALAPPPSVNQPSMDPQSLNLHDYQEELAEPAIQNKNTIIVAPTGSGKTRVAVAIAMNVLVETEGCSQRPHKVIFVVNKVPLVEQQKNAFKPFIGDVVGISGDMSSQVPLAEQLTQASVIVLTAQILLNAIEDRSFRLSQVGLLIMDECHNTQKGSAYNTIMAYYRDLKRDHPEAPRPQVVGLTASLGVKKSKRQIDADSHVLKLCANLDAEEISTVRKYTESLKNSYHRPIEKTFSVNGRDEKDPFKSVLGEIMERIEHAIFSTEEGKEMLKQKPGLRELSSNRGKQQYDQELTNLAKYIPLKVQNANTSRQLQDCVNFLEIYNGSLEINRDARTIDAVHHIEKYIQIDLKDKEQHQQDKSIIPVLIKLFEDQRGRLDEICKGQTNENPVLQKLEEILIEEYTEKRETLAILFTNTRASTQALEAWVLASPALKHLNPGILTGTGRGGMTQSQQAKLLAMFKDEKHKLVIATSVAEEGLDIQMCNLVLRYNYVRDDIGRVQARGRSRAEGGKFYLIFNSRLPHLAERERMNKIRESMMVKATDTVVTLIQSEPDTYKQDVERFQKEDLSERKLKRSGTVAANKRKASQKTNSDYQMICKHCSEAICYADDIKRINGMHHVVMNEDFDKRIVKMDLMEEKDLYGGAIATMEIQCQKCRKKLGFSMIYKGHELPLLTIEKFVIKNSKDYRFHFRKWKDVPFTIKEMDLEDLSKRLDNEDDEDGEDSEESIEEKEAD